MKTLADFKALLSVHPDKNVVFLLPDGTNIPPSFHITEVGLVRKDFVDCGGTLRSTSSCVLQAWVSECDPDHRLTAGKLASILKLADKLIPNTDLPVEVEYEAPLMSQFSVGEGAASGGNLVFRLEGKHTDCLAKGSCGVETQRDEAPPKDCCVVDPVSRECVATCC
jgi:hypothetical protein